MFDLQAVLSRLQIAKSCGRLLKHVIIQHDQSIGRFGLNGRLQMKIRVGSLALRPNPNSPDSHCQRRKYCDEQSLRFSPRQRFASGQSGEIVVHLGRRGITFLRIVGAGLHQHVVKSQQLFAIRARRELRVDFRKIEAVFSGTDFIEKLAETEDVGLPAARSFGRHITFGSDKRTLSCCRDQSDVGELRFAFNENDVRRFDVPMSQPSCVQGFERVS